ncbi:hypothetical protein ACFYSW_15850 [Rhodococcus aetherivorans]|uniref:hypothetical protein n=1 Tax=Rhodococcus aetherivorans TaxID=191292 RepID=UPI0036918E49
MTPEMLFVETVEDLRRRCDLRATEYDVIQASGLLRRLLIDGNPLLSAVTARAKPTFTWSKSRLGVGLGDTSSLAFALVAGLYFDPILTEVQVDISGLREDPPRRMATETGSTKEFLNKTVIEVQSGHPQATGHADVTVRDLIKHFANREGGVHFGPGGKSTNSTLEAMRGQADQQLRDTLAGVGRVAVRALEPLAAAVVLESRMRIATPV